MKFLKGCVAAAIFASGAGFSVAQAYPDRPITVVLPFAAGSPTDSLARVIGAEMAKKLGQALVVENKPGATGIIGTSYVAKAKPDGYTVLFSTNTTQAANVALFKELPYDPVKDFSAVAIVGGVPHALVVTPEVPVNTTTELIEYAKKNPGKLSFPWANSTTRITGSTFGVMTNTQLLAVPYKAYPQAITELIGGQTQMMFIDFVTGLQYIKAGKLKALAITPNRSDRLPGVPAVSEALPGFDIGNWAGIFVPTGTPGPVIEKLNQAMIETLAMPEIKKQVDGIGYELLPSMTPSEFSAFVVKERDLFSELVKRAGIEPA